MAAAIFKKSKNRYISAAVSAISTKFGRVMQYGSRDRLDRYKFEIKRNPRWRRPTS